MSKNQIWTRVPKGLITDDIEIVKHMHFAL